MKTESLTVMEKYNYIFWYLLLYKLSANKVLITVFDPVIAHVPKSAPCLNFNCPGIIKDQNYTKLCRFAIICLISTFSVL